MKIKLLPGCQNMAQLSFDFTVEQLAAVAEIKNENGVYSGNIVDGVDFSVTLRAVETSAVQTQPQENGIVINLNPETTLDNTKVSFMFKTSCGSQAELNTAYKTVLIFGNAFEEEVKARLVALAKTVKVTKTEVTE